MNKLALSILVASVFALPLARVAAEPGTETPDYVTFEGEFDELRADFDAARGKVRAVFLASPTCGICLRGVSELAKKMLATTPSDDLAVFVVWSSQLGAEDRHVAPGMRLMNDARVKHYWDPNQLVGTAYMPIFNVPVPVWDYWLLYPRDAEWADESAIMPAWWEYQGRPMGRPEQLQLDPERFAVKTRELLAREQSAVKV